MTSVPKPLKYLRPHFATLKEIYVEWGDGENKVHCNCDLYFFYLENGRNGTHMSNASCYPYPIPQPVKVGHTTGFCPLLALSQISSFVW